MLKGRPRKDKPKGDADKMTCEEYLELGLIYVREAAWSSAIASLTKARDCYKEKVRAVPAELDSYLGLAVSMNGGDLKEAIKRCRAALDHDSYQPDFYFNLGRVYARAKDKEKAVQAFNLGLQLDEQHKGMKREMKKLGIREDPALTFLPRGHILNKYLGRIRHRLNPSNEK
jgi:tetratricopeptide (TPR) repeat protein